MDAATASPRRGLVAPLPPGGRVTEALWSGLLLLLPLLAAVPMFVVVLAASIGAPLPCPPDADPATCTFEARQREIDLLQLFALWLPAALFVVTLLAVVLLMVLRRRSWPVALLGVVLIAISIAVSMMLGL